MIAQIAGGIVGLSIAWLLDYYFTMRDDKIAQKLAKQHALELAEYKERLRKTS